jgi:dihydroflavonol-4-reductase
MRILVTGSNGFVGKNLVNGLLDRYEDITIHCLVRRPQESNNPKLKYFAIDYLNRSTLINSKAFDEIEYVFHVAGITKSHTEKGFIDGNVTPTKNILKTVCEKNLKIKRFVLVSSQAAGGPADTVDHYKSEHDPEFPVDPYGKSKKAAEQFLIKEAGSLPYTIIRPGAVYGPYDVDFFNIFKMAQSHFSVFAGVKVKYVTLVYSKDLIRAILDAAMAESTKNKLYYICDDRAVTWKEIHDTVFQITGKKKIDISLPFTPILLASYLGSLFSLISGKSTLFNHNKISFSRPKYWIASNRQAKEDFNYQSKYDHKKGFKETYEWYINNNWLKNK